VLYEDVSKKFLPSAVKFTYNWSLRELTNIFQGICMMRNGDYNNAMDVSRIWIHEFARVVSDRFFNISELDVYDGLLREVMKKQLNVPNIDDMLKNPIVFTAFATPSSSSYLPVDSMEVLRKVVDAKLTGNGVCIHIYIHIHVCIYMYVYKHHIH
jgi:dynein heavy chain